MKVAFDHQIFGWQEYGGISRYVYELANGLSEIGVDVAAFSPLYVNRYLVDTPPNFKLVGIRAPWFHRSGRIYRALNSLLVPPALLRFHPDIVHETYYSSVRLAPKYAKVVLTVHDMIHERFPGCYSKFDPTSREKALAVKRADHVICVSENTRQDLVELIGVAYEKTTVIHHGFAIPSLETTGYETSSLHRRPFLLYVGNRDGYKNFTGFIEAYAASPQLRKNFDVVCFGGGPFADREIEFFVRLGIDPIRVCQVAGNDTLLAGLYRSASVFVYPSLYEGFGIPPLEAMSFGCPVVCSNVSAIPEVVGDAAKMFYPLDSGAIAAAIEQVVGDQSVRSVLISRGLARVKNFSWHRCALQTAEVYQRLLA